MRVLMWARRLNVNTSSVVRARRKNEHVHNSINKTKTDIDMV